MRGSSTALLLAVLAVQAAVQAVPLPDPAATPQGGSPPPPSPPPPPPPPPSTCGSCYGAEDPAKGRRCCESCSDVRNAYDEKKWAWPGEQEPGAGGAGGVRVAARMRSRARVPALSHSSNARSLLPPPH